mgnify:CR=1 FL=1
MELGDEGVSIYEDREIYECVFELKAQVCTDESTSHYWCSAQNIEDGATDCPADGSSCKTDENGDSYIQKVLAYNQDEVYSWGTQEGNVVSGMGVYGNYYGFDDDEGCFWELIPDDKNNTIALNITVTKAPHAYANIFFYNSTGDTYTKVEEFLVEDKRYTVYFNDTENDKVLVTFLSTDEDAEYQGYLKFIAEECDSNECTESPYDAAYNTNLLTLSFIVVIFAMITLLLE